MKILYIGDNRNRGNFGCRGTSTALSMLIRTNHEITGVISGKYTDKRNAYLFYYSFLPAWAYRFFGKHKTLKIVFEKIVQILGGRKSDFATLDLGQSIVNLKKCIPSNPMLEELNLENYDFEAMVVNGEGSFIFTTPTWREPLVLSMLIYWAKISGKKVFFMNAMFSDSPYMPRNIEFQHVVDKLLAKCECVIVREKESYKYAKQFLPHVNPQIIPDALFSWFPYINDNHQVDNYRYYIAHSAESDKMYDSIDFSNPYILIAASSSGIGANPISIPTYAYMANQVKKELGFNVYFIQTCDGDFFLNEASKMSNIPIIPMETPLLAVAKVLSKAKCFISGRYHPAVMASQGGTPCIFMKSNSHKTKSIQELLNYDYVKEFSDLPNSIEVKEMVDLAKRYINQGEILRERIKNRAKELYELSLDIINILKQY